jgi:hypothetical protein
MKLTSTKVIYQGIFERRQNSIKISQAASPVMWFKADENDFPITTSVLVFRKQTWPVFQSVSYIKIPPGTAEVNTLPSVEIVLG